MPTQSKTSHFAHRLAQASREELLFRGKQLAWSRLELVQRRLGLTALVERKLFRRPGASSAEGRFFFSAMDLPELTRALRQRLPQTVEETIERAERICSHRFDLLGYRDLDFGRDINWHLDSVNHKEAPRKPFFKIPYLDFDLVGDSKITWELNRHQHFIVLGKAYQLTRNEKYAAEFAEEFYDWQDANPYLIGINWASSLEVALRSLSWLWARELFCGSDVLTARLERDLALSLGRNARFIEHNLSTYFSPNTHLLGEATALFFIGTLCQQLARARGWQNLGWQTIMHEAQRQVRSDGGYFEQATHYHTYAADFFLHARVLASRNGIAIPESFDRVFIGMLDYLAALGAAGPVARFGDDDGGRVFDPSRNRAEHLSDPLSTGAILFNRADWKSVCSSLVEETVWLLGSGAVVEFDALEAVAPQIASRSFPASGTYVMAGDGCRLTIDAGPFGAGHCGHGHSDALAITANGYGREWLTDPGTFTYTGSPDWRNNFRGTGAHNTVRIDDVDQAEATAPFKWGKTPQVQVEHWGSGRFFDLLIASHDGYRRLDCPATHRRTLFFVKPEFWLVIDSIEGEGEHEVEIFWHAPIGPASFSERGLEIEGSHRDRFAVAPVDDPEWTRELIETWRSPSYGQKQLAPALRCAAHTPLPVHFATILAPQVSASACRLQRISTIAKNGAVRGFRYHSGLEQHSFILADARESWRIEDIESDARFAYLEQDSKGIPRRAFLWEGNFLSLKGQRIVNLSSPSEHFEQVWPESDDRSPGFDPREEGALVSARPQRVQ